MITAPAELCIERTSAMLIGKLALDGKLPMLSAELLAPSKRAHQRPATLEEAEAYTWVLAREFERVEGVLAYRDVFDFHTGTDVREVIYISGPATIRLLRWLRAVTIGRRLIGNIDSENARMARAITAIGWTRTRAVYEVL